MLGTDVVVLEGTSLFLRQHDHAPRTSVNRSNMLVLPQLTFRLTLPIHDDVYSSDSTNCAVRGEENDMLVLDSPVVDYKEARNE